MHWETIFLLKMEKVRFWPPRLQKKDAWLNWGDSVALGIQQIGYQVKFLIFLSPPRRSKYQ